MINHLYLLHIDSMVQVENLAQFDIVLLSADRQQRFFAMNLFLHRK